MSDPETLDRLLQSCNYRFRTVLCPHQGQYANITAAKWDVGDAHWTPWNVIDCPLLPAGEVWCDKSCLSQVDVDSLSF
jgi:hypothetical protein